MRLAALVLLGVVCFTRLSVDLLPKVELGVISVSTDWPNTAPEEMEAQITRPIEQALSTLPGLYSISSRSEEGDSSVRVTLDYGVDVDRAAVDVMQLVQRAQRGFPNDPNLQRPTINKWDPNNFPILIFGVSGIEDPVKLRTLLRNEVAPILESAGGVAQVSVSGGQERAIVVDVDPERLQAYGIPISEVISRIRAENISLPAGIAKVGGQEYTIRSSGYFQSVEEAALVPLRSVDGKQILLRDVAQIRDEAQEQRVFARLNGEPAAGITINKQSAANTVETVERVWEKIHEVEERYPELKFGAAYDQAGFVEESIHLLQEHAIIGGSLAILVILFFLRNIRSTVVVALSIPISITSTFAMMYFMGYTLNTITLSALALSTGLIVDDAIVILENIFRHLERDKKSLKNAAIDGPNEIMQAVIASTFTVMVVFIPLFLIKGQSGQIFTQLALVVIFSLAVSLLDATTVVPMLASRVIKRSEVEELEHPGLRAERGKKTTPASWLFDKMGNAFHALDESYRRGLDWSLRRRWVVLAGAAGVTLAVLPLWGMVGNESLPPTDSGDVNVRIRLPIGTALETTYAKMLEVEQILLDDPDVDVVFLSAGANIGFSGGIGGGEANEGSANLRLKAERTSSTEEVIERLNEKMGKIAGIRASVFPFDLVANIIGGNSNGIQVDIFGSDLDQLFAVATDVKDALSDIPGLENVDTNIQDSAPELRWRVDRDRAQAYGLSFQDIASAISVSTNGQLSTYFQEDGFQYPIYVQFPVEDRRTVEDLKQIPVRPGVDGAPAVLLGQVAEPYLEKGPNQINRQNRQRLISVSGRLAEVPESVVQEEVQKRLDAFDFPRGTFWSFGERQQRKQQEFEGLGLAVALAIALIYMLLAAQFESFIYPLVVLFTVPLCIVGVILALFLTDRAFGLTAFVGLLMLIGIVVKNGILLVDYTNQLRDQGLSRFDAILRAGPTRLRPILMTSIASIFGMLPLAASLGAASELQAPLATVVIGGLATSTVLTLFVVPVVYTFFDDLAQKMHRPSEDDMNGNGNGHDPMPEGGNAQN